MKAVVLAAGLGKRLAAITADKPKVLVQVGNKTLIEHNLAKLRKLGFSQIALVIGYKGEMVRETVGGSVTYYEQKERLGTAHAFMQARDFVDDPFFLGLNGDMFFTDPLTDFVKLKPPAIAVYRVEDSSRYGVFEIRNGKVTSVKEKSGRAVPGFINAGVYLFPKEIFSYIEKTPLSPRKEYEVTDTIQMMIDEGFNFTAYELQGFWKDIAYPSDIEEAQEAIKRTKNKQ
jgi:bifunctional UDP-N-acetylglucosamine pyrophosphorylase/glucosamine-1-phosphate N-acetyltransferase